MLESPKWQTMWMESQHCSKTIVNMPLPSQQAKKILEDLKINCSSPNKVVQLEALKCWGIWINNQNPESWKINAVCCTAVRPLLTKKLQPLYKDEDICKVKLSLLWNLIQKVQNVMQLEGPQYILEIFLQFSLTWLSSTDGIDNEISVLIFKLLLALFNKDLDSDGCDKEMFPPLQFDILESKKVFHCFAEKLLNLFVNWRKIKDKTIILKIWKCFLEHCEVSCENIPIPVWHKIFKILGQICSEANENIKDRLLFLHRCATTLKSVLSFSKFIDYGNLLTTPCEALLKKLMELCTIECEEKPNTELFTLSQEICQVLSDESVSLGGYDLCIFVLDLLEEFSLKSLFWGVWCGLVHCFKTRLSAIDKSRFNKMEMKFFRKLRSVAVNFDLDKTFLHKNCCTEVEKHIQVLNISCLHKNCHQNLEENEIKDPVILSPNRMEVDDPVEKIVAVLPKPYKGTFSKVALFPKNNSQKTLNILNLNIDLIKNFLKTVKINSFTPLLEGLFEFQYITLETNKNSQITIMKVGILNKDKKTTLIKHKPLRAIGYSTPPRNKRSESRLRKTGQDEEEIVTTPKTRSKRRAEEEELRKERAELLKRKKRKSFEVLVQEIVKKNKIRKTEKNSKKKSPVLIKKEKNKKKEKVEDEKENEESGKRQLRNQNKEKNEEKKENKINRLGRNSVDGKLENYFKVITRKSGGEKKEGITETPKRRKSLQKHNESNLEKEDKEKKETGWKQTSLKTLISTNLKTEKPNQGVKTRSKSPEIREQSEQIIANSLLLDGSELLKLSPFKEVYHDHDYTKIEPPSPEVLGRMLLGSRAKKLVKEEEHEKSNVTSTISNNKEIKVKDGPLKSEELIKDKETVKEKKNKSKTQISPKEEKGKIKKEKLQLEEVKAEDKMKNPKILDVADEASPRVLRKRKEKVEDTKQAKNDTKEPEKRITRKSLSEQDQDGEKNEKVFVKQKKEKSKKVKKERKSLPKVESEEHMSETPVQNEVDEFDKGKVPKDEILLKKSKEKDEVLDEVVEKNAVSETEKLEVEEKKVSDDPVLFDKTSEKEEENKKVTLEVDSKSEAEAAAELFKEVIEEKMEVENECSDVCTTENLTEEKKSTEKVVEDEENQKTDSFIEIDGSDECGEIKRGKKRFRIMDSLKPNKKIKLDIEEVAEPLLKVMEKENLKMEQEEIDSSVKEEKTVPLSKIKNDSSPKTMSGNISSRALRMIALVPESTRTGQVHRESLTKVEVLKSKKAPNVDKNSRASKMLALLSGNAVKEAEDFEDAEELKVEEESFEKKQLSTPTSRTPVSTLKSPNSVKKKRSIRFDDAKNETILYQIDTPPSQIVEEKEKFRRIKIQEINV